MNQIFIDTNIWLSAVARDIQQTPYCTKLLLQIEHGQYTPYTSNIVIQEFIYVLAKTYKLTHKNTLKYVDQILTTRNLTVSDKTDFNQAYRLYRQTKIKFGDCLIATQVPPKAILVTYDKDFKKIPRPKAMTPKQLLQK